MDGFSRLTNQEPGHKRGPDSKSQIESESEREKDIERCSLYIGAGRVVDKEKQRGRAKRKVSYAVLLPMMMDYLRKDEEKRRENYTHFKLRHRTPDQKPEERKEGNKHTCISRGKTTTFCR